MRSVKEIQTALAELKIYTGKIDGSFGPASLQAVRAFQRLHGLEADGRVGRQTEYELFPAPITARAEPAPILPAPHPALAWPRQADCEAFYGPVGQHQKSLVLPFRMKLAWDLRKSVDRISVHEKVHDSAGRAFAAIAKAYSAAERKDLGLDLYGGSLAVRKMRGGTSWSMHAWGIAIDFDPTRNQLRWGRDRARLALDDAADFWAAWAHEGWVSLGHARNFDWMHVQAARL